MTEEVKNLATEAIEAPVEITETPVEASEKFAKSGKKSKKHVEEVKAEEARQARKAEAKLAEAAEKPRGEAPKVRSILERRGKNYRAAHAKIDHNKTYSLEDAIKLAIETNPHHRCITKW